MFRQRIELEKKINCLCHVEAIYISPNISDVIKIKKKLVGET